MGEAKGQPSDRVNDAIEAARQVATDPALPAWAVEAVGLLLDGDMATVDLLETLTTEAGVLFGRGRRWLTD